MTCENLIRKVINSTCGGESSSEMERDTAAKLIVLAYYMGREAATKKVSDQYSTLIKEQRRRADECRYRNMANAIIGDIDYIYSSDYAGEMTAAFGQDDTELTVAKLSEYD